MTAVLEWASELPDSMLAGMGRLTLMQAARLAGSAEGAVHWSGSDAEGLAGEVVGNLDSAEPEVFLEGYDEANGITDVIEDG
mmetsp:Transcript_34835/g.79018  ORF Transcript_34835/g.79018 Transcript_34835/m.79018 type:complete len:82 (-) Transcript_34835:185-430(-)